VSKLESHKEAEACLLLSSSLKGYMSPFSVNGDIILTLLTFWTPLKPHGNDLFPMFHHSWIYPKENGANDGTYSTRSGERQDKKVKLHLKEWPLITGICSIADKTSCQATDLLFCTPLMCNVLQLLKLARKIIVIITITTEEFTNRT